MTDENEMMQLVEASRAQREATVADLNEWKQNADRRKPKPRSSLTISEQELESAQLSPDCIVENFLYADLGQMVAPGGTGKTTLLLYESIQIALGLPVFGCEVLKPGWTLIITGEDRREYLVARIRCILEANGYTPEQKRQVLSRVIIWDVVGVHLQLIYQQGSEINHTGLANDIVDAYRDDPPVQVIIDPLASFSASEKAVNDNEQALVLSGRSIVRGLNCCLRYVHHTGKGVAREQTMDQYAGRGGSALADGCRMVSTLFPWREGEGAGLALPHDMQHFPETGERLSVYQRAKLSYAEPNLPTIWIKRTGFMFDYHIEREVSADREREMVADRLARFIGDELKAGRRHSKTGLSRQASAAGLSRSKLLEALDYLFSCDRVAEVELDKEQRHGRKKTYIHLV